MIDSDMILSRLLEAETPFELPIPGDGTARMTPVRYVPPTAWGDDSIPLSGEWSCRRWPFPLPEAEMAGNPEAADEIVQQPGKVFYEDPACDPGTVENWNRVRLHHVGDDDGAMLWHTVTVPASWKGKRIRLRFDAVYPAARFYINGELLGEHLSGLTRIEFDITDHATPGGTVLLGVRLLRKHAYVRLDMPRHAMSFAGINQPATLYAVEPCHIGDVCLPTLLAEDGTGSIQGEVILHNTNATHTTAGLTLCLRNQRTGDQLETTASAPIPAGEEVHVPLHLDAGKVERWSDETPRLYEVMLRVVADDQPARDVTYRVGFKRFELRDGRAWLNGRPVKFRGVNLLTFSPEGGMYMDEAWLRANLRMMKKCNINGIRTHFTAPTLVADLCDEMGFLLVQEITIDWVSEYIGKASHLGAMCMRVEATVRRDRHHASLLAFGIGNENQADAPEAIERFWQAQRLHHALVKSLAPDVMTMIPPPGPTNQIPHMMETRVADIADMHYSFKDIRSLDATGAMKEPQCWPGPFKRRTRGELSASGWSGVWFSSEWGLVNHIPDLLEAPYLSLIADTPAPLLQRGNTLQTLMDRLAEEWGYMRESDACLGGAFFPWMCSGAGDPWGWTLFGEDADWGVVTHDLLPKPGFWALRVVYAPVRLPESVRWVSGSDGVTVVVRSLYNGIDLAECTFRTMMGNGGLFMGQMRQWRDIEVSCPPGGCASVTIPIWNEVTRKALEAGLPAICRCHVLDPSGFRVLTHDIRILPESLTEDAEEHVVIGPDANLTEV